MGLANLPQASVTLLDGTTIYGRFTGVCTDEGVQVVGLVQGSTCRVIPMSKVDSVEVG
jgi:hypothetical protein